MPFAVFRRHQKKLLAVFAIMAMVAFVLSDSINKSIGRNSGRNADRVVVDLFGKPVRKTDLDELAQRRNVANRFFFMLSEGRDALPFGGYTTRELVNAYLLKHEADRLGIPETPEVAREYLRQLTGGRLTRQIFESLIRQGFNNEVTGEQVLTCLASQIRLLQARALLGQPLVSPLDIFDAYREQNERSSFRVVSFPAVNFLDKVGEPTEAEIQALYDTAKELLPDPDRDTPGFKVPREITVETVSVDGAAVAKGIQDKLTEAELKTYYETRKSDFAKPNELPADLFKDDPTAALTPTQYLSFADVKDSLAAALSRERAQEQISDKLAKFREATIEKFADKYHDAVSDNAEAKKYGETRRVPVPELASLAEAAKAQGLDHETTPPLNYEAAKIYGTLGNSHVGLDPLKSGEIKFADAIFGPKTPVYDGMEFSEPGGRRYSARKIADNPPRVAPLSEVRPDVIAAWKLGKARALAEKAARELAESIKKSGGKIKDQIVAGRPVIAIEGQARMNPGFSMPGSGLQYLPPTKAELVQIPKASDTLREAIFNLKPGEVAVDSDIPKQVYYVVALDRRDPATFSGLYGLTGMPMSYREDALRKAFADDFERRMSALRTNAGLPKDWAPPNEKDRPQEADSEG